jgi:carbonic anhydrase
MPPFFATASWCRAAALQCAALAVCAGLATPVWAADPSAAGHDAPAAATKPAAKASAKAEGKVETETIIERKTADVDLKASSEPKAAGYLVREALGVVLPNKKLTVMVKSKPHAASEMPAVVGPESGPAAPAAASSASRRYNKARAAAMVGHAPAKEVAAAAAGHGGEVHWSYEGDNGPQAWGKLKPEFNLCATGKRQSPINIEDGATLQGPAEPVRFDYTPSNGTVVNNGHTIQVDVQGENSITVRGSSFSLLQFHFHTPSEEQINYKRFSMVVHLVHKNAEGQLAVVAVLLEPGEPNPAIERVWTYMPLDTADRVRMPLGMLNLNELLPADQRYYQFMGSLTTPPCTEGVLWLVLKQPVTISRAQLKLFTQLYAHNARPVQAINARPVREAQ